MPKSKATQPTMTTLLRALEKEASEKGNYNIKRDGMFRCVLRAAFVKSFEFAHYCNAMNSEMADESCFFLASALRGICEDLIALKFLRQLSRKDRDEVTIIEISIGMYKAVVGQSKFFIKERPFQVVLSGSEDKAHLEGLQARLSSIGTSSGLWNTGKKLPPIEQMAIKLNMRPMYDYFYRATSDVVHFSPRIALRSGWGADPRRGRFSTKNFTPYYLLFCQTYSVWLFAKMARAFAADLALSRHFRDKLTSVEKELNEQGRWPEAVTYEEMNKRPPNMIMGAILRVMWDDPEGRRMLRRRIAKEA